MSECIHGMDAETCSLCRRLTTPPDRVMEAGFPSDCRFCAGKIHMGQTIGLTPDYGWIHSRHFANHAQGWQVSV